MIFHMIRSDVVVVDDTHTHIAYTRRGAQPRGRITRRESESVRERERGTGRGEREKLGLMKKEEVERRACAGLVYKAICYNIALEK